MRDGLFRINAPDVINEVIDGEAIILHLGTGRYYSARGCGAQLWSWLSTSVPVSVAVELLERTYDADRSAIERAVDEFIAQLEEGGLLVEASGPAAEASDIAIGNGTKLPFEPPAVECYTDLQDLLLLDPVHEVSAEKGWPHAAEGAVHRVDAG